ncbi:metal dependent phosphohydrolase [Asticcacaulis biprosthecium C19]|uniref:Metal dependent phosphohydrolase n=1 Tax=Asticcacaulis biprosthecium C19 TaxID=715226 RepID=F4QSS0_9CAUL|nr:HD domain-containing protein [Asticcacaulis biprosthecium]EGF89790.1 metal dependent phosphohydrolase [Asticcacaulis biprosthecium C19]
MIGTQALKQEICTLYLREGHNGYGLYHLNQLQHGLQAAAHAQAQGLSAALIVAALLHDVGHMVHDLGETPAEAGVDDRHEEVGAQWAAKRFPPDVSEPIRLHVAAKRYLCGAEDGYEATLSKDSVISLALQGGAMDGKEQAAFLAQAHAREAIALRRIDDIAKDPHATTRPLEVFLDAYLEQALCGSGGEPA